MGEKEEQREGYPRAGSFRPRGNHNPFGIETVIWVRVGESAKFTGEEKWLTHYKVTVISKLLIPTVRETQVHIHHDTCGCPDLKGKYKDDLYWVSQQIGNSVRVNPGVSIYDVARVTSSRPIDDPPPGMPPP